MAVKKDAKEVAKIEETTALTEIPQDLIDHAGHGSESIGAGDFRPARLLVAQKTSQQLERGHTKYMKGLAESHLFNDLSGQIYNADPEDDEKRVPVEFVVVSFLGAKGVQFDPDQLGVVIDGDVPLNDPRMDFTQDPNDPKKRLKPIATKFFDYMVWLPQTSEFIALSLKGTQLKTAMTLNSLLKQPLNIGGKLLANPPSWGRTYLLGVAQQKNDQGSWAGLTLGVKGLTDAAIRAGCAQLYEDIKNRKVDIARDDSAAETVAPAAGAQGDDVPF